MRTYRRRERYPITKENEIATFLGELEYYRSNNQNPVLLLGHRIVNIYRNINVQVVLSKKCNFACPFCIENDRTTDTDGFLERSCFLENIFDMVIQQYDDHGITPHVSITGGEPTLFPEKLKKIYGLAINKWHLPFVNINTNGTNPDVLKDMENIWINLSRHHYCETKADEIFGKKSDYTIIPNTTMQCVMMKGYIDSVAEIKKYMDFFITMRADGFSFRGMSTLDAGKQYTNEVNFSAVHAIDFFSIVEEISNDPDFEFVQQKIGDHYWFEIYNYRGKPVRFTYSNFDFLRKVETEERKNKQWFSRATVISPVGKVYAGWTYDINELTLPNSLRPSGA